MQEPQDTPQPPGATADAAPAGQHVDMPESMRVHCPLAGFKLRQVSKCLDCPHLAGGALVDRFPGAGHLALAQRYVVPCTARPTMREIKEVEL